MVFEYENLLVIGVLFDLLERILDLGDLREIFEFFLDFR